MELAMIQDFRFVHQPLSSDAEQAENSLICAAQSGDLDSFNLLVLKYQNLLYGTALRILGDDNLAQDATQEAFVSACRHIDSFRGGSLKAWLVRIVINKCYDLARGLQRHQTISLNEIDADECVNMDSSVMWDGSQSVEQCVETAEMGELIGKCLDAIPVDARAIITLIDVENLSYREVAKALKIPVGTVKSRLARARFRLRQELMASGKFFWGSVSAQD